MKTGDMKTEDKLRWIENKVRGIQTHSEKFEPIAIVGLSGMFPQCADVEAFWRVLDADEAVLEEIPTNRLKIRTKVAARLAASYRILRRSIRTSSASCQTTR